MKKLLILAGLAAAFATSPVMAGESSQIVRTQTISYSDLDLRTKEGAAELKHRVRTTLVDFCGSASSSDLAGQNKVNRCLRENKRQASAKAAAAIARATPATEVRIANSK